MTKPNQLMHVFNAIEQGHWASECPEGHGTRIAGPKEGKNGRQLKTQIMQVIFSDVYRG